MTQKLHTGLNTWTSITGAVTKSRGATLAAVAFIGVDAPSLLPLKRGDALVCDASPERISDGTTSAKALSIFRKRGVHVYSYPQLHAKVVALPRRAFVGSANASHNSDENLNEAVLESTDRSVVAAARDFVSGLMHPSFLLSSKDVRTRLALKVVRSYKPSGGGIPRAGSPRTVDRLWVVSTWPIERSAAAERVHRSEGPTMTRVARNDSATLDDMTWDAAEAREMRPDDWLICVHNNRRVHAPAKILKVTPTKKNEVLIWLARPRNEIRSLPASEPECALTVALSNRDGAPTLVRRAKADVHLVPFVLEARTGRT